MRAVCLAVVFAALVPAAARGEPIPVSVASAVGGFSQQGTTLTNGLLSLGSMRMPSVNSVGTFLIEGLRTNTDVVVSFMLEGIGRFDTLRLEVLNPAGSNDNFEPPTQPDYMPAGYSSSNNADALSFGQASGLERSAVFARGSASVFADEFTHRGDILIFSGLAGARWARVTFAIRDGLKFSAEVAARDSSSASARATPCTRLSRHRCCCLERAWRD